MKHLAPHVAVVLLAVTAPVTALAQERGRTDGPEGSEFGQGGYADPGGGHFSLELNWGASTGPVSTGAPLFVGATASYWADDWFLLDVSGAHLLHDQSTELLIGPRFRTAFFPVSASIALNAGPMFQRQGVRFALSPQVGGDILLADKVILGLGGAADVVLGGNNAYRLFMNVGYRF